MAAKNGHLDALKYLRTELRCDWRKRNVLEAAAGNGHVHVLQWVIENGASLVLADSEDTAAMHQTMMTNACNLGHVQVLEWLLAAQPAMVDEVTLHVILSHPPKNKCILEVLTAHVGVGSVLNTLDVLVTTNNSNILMPPVMEWCIQQGMRFQESYFYITMMNAACDGDVQRMEDYLRLGGQWLDEYFHVALSRNHLALCQWAHKHGLELDLARIDLNRLYEKDTLAWLASLGVFVSTSELTVRNHYSDAHDASVRYIIQHYPRYAIHIKRNPFK